MTVIAAAVAADGTVTMAADSVSVTECGRVWSDRAKIVRKQVGRNETALLATCGAGTLQELARYDLTAPVPPDPGDDDDCAAWAHAVAVELTELAAETKPPTLDENGELDGSALLAYSGRLWYVSQQSALRVPVFTAIGSGGHAAVGALDVLLARGVRTREAVVAACEAACRHDIHCRPPILVESLG